MTPEFVLSLGHETIKLVLLLSLPLLGTGLVVGLLVAILQATTQIQEMTLSFVPKMHPDSPFIRNLSLIKQME